MDNATADSLSDLILEDILSKYKSVYKMIVSQPYGPIYADLASYLLNLPTDDIRQSAEQIKLKCSGVWTLDRLKEELERHFNEQLLAGLNKAIQLDSQRLLELVDQNREPFVSGYPNRYAFDQESFEGWSQFFHRWRQVFDHRKDGCNFDLEDLHSYVTEMKTFYRSFSCFLNFVDKWPFPHDWVFPWYDETFGKHLKAFFILEDHQLSISQSKFNKDSNQNKIDTSLRQCQKVVELRTEFLNGLRQLCLEEMEDVIRWRTPEDSAQYREMITNALSPYRRRTEEIIDNMKSLKTRAPWRTFIRIEHRFANVVEAVESFGNNSEICKNDLRIAIGRYIAKIHNQELRRLEVIKENIVEMASNFRSNEIRDSVVVKSDVTLKLDELLKVYRQWKEFIEEINHVLTSSVDRLVRIVYNWSEVEGYFKNVHTTIGEIVHKDTGMLQTVT